MPVVIRIRSSEWCSVSRETLGGSNGYTVEARDIRELGVQGERGERIDDEVIMQIRDDVDVVVIVECEFDHPHIIAISPRNKITHYLSP